MLRPFNRALYGEEGIAMKLSSNMKKWLLAGVMVSALALTGCYMAPDQGALDDTNNLTVGNNTLPFNSIAPLPTDVPTPVPTAVPTVNTGSIGQVDWDQNWGTTVTLAPNVVQPNIGVTVTLPPVNTTTTSRPATMTPKPTAAPTSSTLKTGSSGSEVKEMQQRLKELKYYTGSVDGDFGAGTEAAVREFQQNNGLTVDGKAGKKTLDALFSYYAVPKTSTSGSKVTVKPSTSTATQRPSATAVPTVSDNTYLQLNASGTKVRQMQERLISLGYLAGNADGKFGEATEAAVKAFQNRNGLWDDGIAGPDTLRLLYSSSAKRASSLAASIGETLEEGSEGSAVRALQRKLIALGYLSGSADGDFGAATKAAVIEFQKNNGLTADGKAGTSTLNKLYSGNAVSANGSSSSSDSASSTGYTTLKDGSEGSSVKKLQQKLKQLGYYTGSVDGKYGAGTEAAVSAFQRANKLTVDGKAGPTTQRLLYGGNAANADTSSTLETGDSGSRVRELQQALYELGYYQATIHGTYDKNTSNAVREFQINNGLSVDGKAGKKTLELLYSPYARASGNEAVSYNTVMLGDKGEDVVMVQQLLYKLGYSNRKATGEFDQETKDALIKFQKKNGISPQDGIAGPTTQSKLFSSSAIKN